MQWNHRKWPLSCLGGGLVILLYCAFTFIAWALYPSPYGPITHYLSALGDWGDSPSGAFFYNAGCVLTGLALIPFFMGLYEWYGDRWWRKGVLMVGQGLGAASAIALMMIGVFSQDFGQPHMLASTVFFALNFVVLLLVNLALITHPGFLKGIGVYGFSINFLSVAFELTVGGPITEWLTVFGSLVFVGLLVINTYSFVNKSKGEHSD